MRNEDASAQDSASDRGTVAFLTAVFSTMDWNWAARNFIPLFPERGDRAEDAGSPKAAEVAEDSANAHWRSLSSAYIGMAEFMQKSFDTALATQDTAVKEFSGVFADAFRGFTGVDPAALLAGSESDWTPNRVLLQSFGLGESDTVSTLSEVTHLALSAGKSAEATLAVISIVNSAWLRAARTFAEQAPAATATLGPIDFQRAWAGVAEPILQDTLRSDAFVKAHAVFLRASSQHAKARSALSRRVADFLEVPSRQEMDGTYEAIQQLRREVRALKRSQAKPEPRAPDVIPAPTQNAVRSRKKA
jgi:Poly(R)-hydroxyalkanoic acid synthase subunit (PHA_synth_III_E)